MSLHFRYSLFILMLLLILLLAAAPISAQDTTSGAAQDVSFDVTYGGSTYDSAANQTTFTYIVSGTGSPPDLSHFDVEIPVCTPALVIAATSPTAAVSFGVDPTTGINGVKWDISLGTTETRTYTLTFVGDVAEGSIQVAVKGGNGFVTISLPGPSCDIHAIDVEKYVSVDGGISWQDADEAPGPDVELDADVQFRLVVTNNGTSTLTNISLVDSVYDVTGCTLPAALEPEGFFECELGPFPVAEGQHTNIATAGAIVEDDTSASVTDSDSANYFGGDRPSVNIQKFVSDDGGATWVDANQTPGPEVEIGSDVHFRFVVTNDGNVPLTAITLLDSAFGTESCTIPDTLEPEDTFECVIGPFPAEEGQHTNTAAVNAAFDTLTISATDTANYFGGELDETNLPITIIIEGPVGSININIITIYGIEIQLDPNDPLLTVIRIGDRIRVEGDIIDGADTIIIVAINIIIVDADVVIIDSGDGGVDVWRNVGDDCSNPPPPWAPAHGWRAKCEGAPHPGGGRGRGN